MYQEKEVKKILNKHKNRDPWFLDDYSINPYYLCEFNCLYCYIRGSKYGEHMPKLLTVKMNAHKVLEKELYTCARKNEYGFIALSTATEAWMNIEEKYKLTRKCLSIIAYYKFPVHCITKSPLILRDLDLLSKIHRDANIPPGLSHLHTGAFITISISTLDKYISRIFEPNAPTPDQRLDIIQQLKNEKLTSGIAFIPVLPYISDTQETLESMIKTAKYYEVSYIFIGSLTLFGKGKQLYFKVLEKKFPDLIPKYKELYKHRNYPPKQYQLKLENKAIELCKKYNVKYRID